MQGAREYERPLTAAGWGRDSSGLYFIYHVTVTDFLTPGLGGPGGRARATHVSCVRPYMWRTTHRTYTHKAVNCVEHDRVSHVTSGISSHNSFFFQIRLPNSQNYREAPPAARFTTTRDS